MEHKKSCPYGFSDFSFKNILIVLLILKQVWSMFKDSTPEVNIEDLLVKSQIPGGIPIMSELSPLLHEVSVPSPPKPSCGGNWIFTKILLVLLLFYIVYFIKTVVDKITLCSMELNVNGRNSNMECPLMECPLGFGRRCEEKDYCKKTENNI